jgi:hypothetical protein
MPCPLLHDEVVLSRILVFLRENSTTSEFLPVLRVCRRIYAYAILVISTPTLRIATYIPRYIPYLVKV